jgi:hypothetical protein
MSGDYLISDVFANDLTVRLIEVLVSRQTHCLAVGIRLLENDLRVERRGYQNTALFIPDFICQVIVGLNELSVCKVYEVFLIRQRFVYNSALNWSRLLLYLTK